MNKTALTLAALALSAPAHAVEFSLGAGYTRFAEQADGVWRQEAYPHWMDMDSPSLSVGVSFRPREVRYAVEFLYLGDLYIQGEWVDDNKYNPANVGCLAAGTCTSVVGQVRSNVAGVVFSAARDVPVFGIPFYAEAGIFANVQKVKVNVMELDGTLITEVEREHQINYGPVLGFGVRYSGVDLGLRFVYLDDSGEDDPITPAAPYAMSLMYKAYF
jgi:hypothetical protein